MKSSTWTNIGNTSMTSRNSPQADLADAEKLIKDCGYRRRDEELADAKRAILAS